jgi:hypothetical protein
MLSLKMARGCGIMPSSRRTVNAQIFPPDGHHPPSFTGVAELDRAIHKAVEDLNREQALVPLVKPRIPA